MSYNKERGEKKEIEIDGKITFFNRSLWYKKKNICPACEGDGEGPKKYNSDKHYKCFRCNGDGKYHEYRK